MAPSVFSIRFLPGPLLAPGRRYCLHENGRLQSGEHWLCNSDGLCAQNHRAAQDPRARSPVSLAKSKKNKRQRKKTEISCCDQGFAALITINLFRHGQALYWRADAHVDPSFGTTCTWPYKSSARSILWSSCSPSQSPCARAFSLVYASLSIWCFESAGQFFWRASAFFNFTAGAVWWTGSHSGASQHGLDCRSRSR